MALAGGTADESTAECIERGQLSQEACEAASEIGVGAGATIVLCVGGFFFALFALLAWRNGVGLATERRHQEQLEAARRSAGSGIADAPGGGDWKAKRE